MKKTALILVAALLSAAFLFAGGSQETAAASASAADTAVDPDKPYAGVKLTWWTKPNANVTTVYSNLGETPWAQYVMERTGIEIEFIHPTSGSASEQFAIMIASGDYPDIIEHTWTTYSGGPVAAINDGVILDLDDLMETNAPNFMALMDENPDVDKMVKTSTGHYYCFPFLRGLKQPNITQFSGGIVIRQDVLDELGLERPETIDEWEVVLRAFKEYGFEKPFVTRAEWMKDIWSPGFDNWGNFYVEDGVVKNGLIEDSRFEFLKKMNQWYAEGLIDRDYLVANKKSNQTDFTTGKAAACNAPFGQGLGQYTSIMHDADPEITQEDLRCTVPVTSKKGQNAKFSKMNQIYDQSGVSAAISTDCRNVEAAMWLLDWMYSEEGNLCCNFGIEGVSYEMVDGVPTYTELITNNPDLQFANALAVYTRASTSGVCVQDEEYIRQYYSQDNQKEALELSMKTDMGEHFYPPTSVKEEYSEEYAEIMNNVKTYSDEMEAQFISGAVSLDEWPKYIKQLKDFGIEKAIAMLQEAYDVYMSN